MQHGKNSLNLGIIQSWIFVYPVAFFQRVTLKPRFNGMEFSGKPWFRESLGDQVYDLVNKSLDLVKTHILRSEKICQ